MEELKKIWSTDGLLVDKNGDGVVDGLSLFIDLPQNLMPEGLLDFFARMGFETTALSFKFFKKEDQQMTMRFQQDDETTAAELTGSCLLCRYRNEAELSALLTDIASMDQGAISTPVTKTRRSIESLASLWSHSGFGSFEEATPHHHLSLMIQADDDVKSSELFQELCHFAARCALYSTSIELPVTGNRDADIHFHAEYGQDTKLSLSRENRLKLTGTKESCPNALASLNNSRHWSEQGGFGYWEQEMKLEDKQQAVEWYETKWTDVSEKELVIRYLESLPKIPSGRMEVYLSEPLEIRNSFREELRGRYPGLDNIVVRSAFKTGFHWIREELLPELSSDSIGIHISFRKETREDGLELPIRWLQELYPIDKLIEKTTHVTADRVTFSLEDQLQSTYKVEVVMADGTRQLLGEMEVPTARIPYINDIQFAYPSTGAVKVFENAKLSSETLIPTDRERFYLFYLQQFLPGLQNKLSGINEGQGHVRPLFDRLEIDVTMSEEEEKLGVDEERTSSLEALYEDLYFNTLDFFAEWGLRKSGKAFDSPGGVHPFMHVEKGVSPSAAIKVYKWEEREAVLLKTVELDFDEEGRFVTAAVLKNGQTVQVPIKKQKETNFFRGMDNGRTILVDHSFKGIPIPAIEYYLESGEAFDSAIKLTLFKKTIVIEAGHHANEISSTPAVMQLGEEIGRFLKELNVVVIPNANPDGFQLLKKMTEEHPEWKHHAARYNAVGLEFAHVRYQETVFGEANVLPLLLKKWAPDVVSDDHGIPAHEWVQPFAGYNSPPRFPVSYFLPSAKIYGIGRISETAHKPVHQQNLEAIVDSISSKIAGTTIAAANDYWKQRFIKYGHDWLPEVFPIEDAPHLHFYRQQTVTPKYPTVSILRYPEWVAADIISEAADEVVQGEILESCIQAQILFNEGILELLQKQHPSVSSSGLAKHRQRPLRLSSRLS